MDTTRPMSPTNPSHYRKGGVETIDKIRSHFKKMMGEHDGAIAFIGFCTGNAIKYRDRAGHKEGSTEEEDEYKARWYDQMVAHTLDPDNELDPRSEAWKS